jgi:GT2 family glycosyltransferase
MEVVATGHQFPYVRIVVLNYNGGDVTLRCLNSLQNINYPTERFEICLIDNGSTDGLDWKIPRMYPTVKYHLSLTNEGFARGCNLGMEDLEGIDAIALVNNDAVVQPSFLSVLVDTLFGSERIAAVSPLMMLDLEASGFDIWPLNGKCVKLSGFRNFGSTVNFHLDTRWVLTESGAVTNTDASVWSTDLRPHSLQQVQIELSGKPGEVISITSGDFSQQISLSREPTWYDIEIPLSPVSVVNNAGGILTEKWFGGDRGFRQIDRGQFNSSSEVFTFCGGAVLIKSSFLRTVGVFDSDYFLYYEDTELSLRGQRFGWSFMYNPNTLVFHRHSYSSVENSAFFNFWVDRNRRMTLIRHAPLHVAVAATLGILPYYLKRIVSSLWRGVHYRRKAAFLRGRRLFREMLSCVKAVPSAYKKRVFYSRHATHKIDYRRWLVKRAHQCE